MSAGTPGAGGEGSGVEGSWRVYVPVTPAGLVAARDSGEVVAQPAHAVTDALRAALPGADEEELAWSALTTAAQASLELVTGVAGVAETTDRRMVLVLDVRGAVAAGDPEDPTAVRLMLPGAWRRAAAIHADLPEAADAVRAARAAYAAGDAGLGEDLAQECLAHELGWYGVQELDTLLG